MPRRMRSIVSARVPAALLALALVVGAGGTATAAKLITGKNIKDGSVTGADIKNRSLTGADVKDRSLKASDLAKGVLPTVVAVPGQPGATGPSGPPGAAAFGSLVYAKGGPFDNPAGEVSKGAVVCPEGRYAIGGGAWGDAEAPGQAVTASAPATEGNEVAPSRWQVWMANATAEDASFDVYAICATAGAVSTR